MIAPIDQHGEPRVSASDATGRNADRSTTAPDSRSCSSTAAAQCAHYKPANAAARTGPARGRQGEVVASRLLPAGDRSALCETGPVRNRRWVGRFALVVMGVLAGCTDGRPVEVSAGRRNPDPPTTETILDATTSTSRPASSSSSSTSTSTSTRTKPKPSTTTTTGTVFATTTTAPAVCAPAGPAGPFVNGLYFSDFDHGWAAMKAPLRRTEDGGVTWTAACFPESVTSFFVSTVTFQGERGWAVLTAQDDQETNALVGTTDGGRRWQRLSLPAGTRGLRDLVFVDADHGWIVGTAPTATGNPITGGGGVVLSTTDGGVSWASKQLPEDIAGGLRHLSFVDRSHGWATGQTAAGAPVVLATANGGANWTACPLPAEVMAVRGMAFTDEHRGWVAAGVPGTDPSQETAVILATTDGCATWTMQANIPGIILWDLGVIDADHAWAAGGSIEGTLLTTADGGATWRQFAVPGPALQTAFFTDPMHGWAGTLQRQALWSTADGGATWVAHPVS